MPKANIVERVQRAQNKGNHKKDSYENVMELEGTFTQIKENLPENIKNLVNEMKEKATFLNVRKNSL